MRASGSLTQGGGGPISAEKRAARVLVVTASLRRAHVDVEIGAARDSRRRRFPLDSS
jgi:hypothetical protein